MFGLGRSAKKPEPEKKKRSHDLTQFGLFDVPGADDHGIGDTDDDDGDLEAELAAITAGAARLRAQPKKPFVPAADLDRMVAESMRDDDEHGDDDEDVDENDPDLLSELHELGIGGNDAEKLLPPTPPQSKSAEPDVVELLQKRLELYRLAEANAKAAGDAGKARRIGRGLKTLTDQLKQAKAGRPVNMDDIPPEVTTKAAGAASDTVSDAPAPTPAVDESIAPAAVPTRVAPPLPPRPSLTTPTAAASDTPTPAAVAPVAAAADTTNDNAAVLQLLLARKREFQVAAVTAKKAGDRDTAMQHIRVLKQFDVVIAEAEAGRPVDLSAMPVAPGAVLVQTSATAPPSPQRTESERQSDAEPVERIEQPAAVPAQPLAPPAAPATVAEALQQRLDKYRSVELAAKAEGNASKARRYGRIIKQYEDAVRAHRAGRPVAFAELPTPPGFGPIPGVAAAPEVDAAAVAAAPIDGPEPPSLAPAAPVAPAPTAAAATAAVSPPPPAKPNLPLPASRLHGNHSSTQLMQQNIAQLTARQTEFRRAAVEAKQSNNLPLAKEYLRQFKQLEQMLEVARGGMPVDMATVPLAPAQAAKLEDTFDMVSEQDCKTDASGMADISERLEQQLLQQLALCRQTRDHLRAMGDVAGTNRFGNLALSVQKDLDVVKLARAHNLPVPKFHYERKRFDIVRCNTDLSEAELEINVLRGIGYAVPNPRDVDTYVKVEVPLPSAEAPFRGRTQLIRDTDSPVYDEKFVVEMQPKQRAVQRVFKRHAVKLEVMSKGGFLRSDTLIGTVTVKLQPLETQCEVHESFDLMDGRKTTGGKLEVRIRTRNPILTTQIEHTDEKWLCIDSA